MLDILDRTQIGVAYEALSCVLGKPSPMHVISCNSEEFAVGRNLETALRRLRSNTVARVVWIDAICINQADLDERPSQLQIMGDIYSKARHVLIWLGDDDGSFLISAPFYKKWQNFFEKSLKLMIRIVKEIKH